MTITSTPARFVALGLLSLVLVACGGDDSTLEPTPAPTSGPAVEVAASEFKYEPSEVTIPSTGSTTIRLVNKGVVEHDWTIEELDVKIEAAIGKSAEGTLTDIAPGTYKVYCTVPGHEAAGMVGSLVVTE